MQRDVLNWCRFRDGEIYYLVSYLVRPHRRAKSSQGTEGLTD